jgi:hypothetical protein
MVDMVGNCMTVSGAAEDCWKDRLTKLGLEDFFLGICPRGDSEM